MLDGSASLEAMSQISNKTIDEIKDDVMAPAKCHNLSDYLTRFTLPIECMQTKEDLKLIGKKYADYCESQNIIYAEPRFAPNSHTTKGLTFEEIIESILEGFENRAAQRVNKKFSTASAPTLPSEPTLTLNLKTDLTKNKVNTLEETIKEENFFMKLTGWLIKPFAPLL